MEGRGRKHRGPALGRGKAECRAMTEYGKMRTKSVYRMLEQKKFHSPKAKRNKSNKATKNTLKIARSWQSSTSKPLPSPRLLDGDRLGQVTREVHIQTSTDGQPVRDQLERNDIQQTLKSVHGLGDHNLLGLCGRELRVVLVADDNGATTSSNDCYRVSFAPTRRGSLRTLLIGIQGLGEQVVAGEDHDDR